MEEDKHCIWSWKKKTSYGDNDAVTHSDGSIILWRYFFSSRNRKDGQSWWNINMATLKEKLLEPSKDCNRGHIFHLDNNPERTARMTTAWIGSRHISLLEWSCQGCYVAQYKADTPCWNYSPRSSCPKSISMPRPITACLPDLSLP